jgi:hypothetical protein
MRRVLNRFVPYDAMARWWYVLAGGSGLGLVFSLTTNYSPFRPLVKVIPFVDGPLADAKFTVWQDAAAVKDDLLFTVLGFLMACALVWLLEEIREYSRMEG